MRLKRLGIVLVVLTIAATACTTKKAVTPAAPSGGFESGSFMAALKQKGELVFDVPATHEFDVGRFNEDTMAFPPGVTVKDFQSDVSEGYPNPKPGGQPARFKSIIQIVPVAAAR